MSGIVCKEVCVCKVVMWMWKEQVSCVGMTLYIHYSAYAGAFVIVYVCILACGCVGHPTFC